ncbi:hypothetical protein QUF99_23055 [Bacillus sp. DX4.1]|uniref:hypothetical protein n=1 Tax=Bacillus sp. DX4.1 TaxID=3055867 RepID=UPI0025A0A8C8|nr:hypothetical protein [Bacillus sp. DX4.1]MDM5190107.1 hypothetical protein [Bacillus sp. DX4.1]
MKFTRSVVRFILFACLLLLSACNQYEDYWVLEKSGIMTFFVSRYPSVFLGMIRFSDNNT